MQGERLLTRLIEADVLDETGEIPVRSESFDDRVDAYETELALQEEGAELAERVREEVPELRVPNLGSTFDSDDVPYLAELLALADHLEETETALQVLPTLDLFGENPPPVDGAPELFVQVSGPRLRTLVKLYERTIVYAWGHDCPPCEIVQEDLDDALEEPMEGIPLLAVCGDDCPQLLHETFELRGAPTVLFVIEGHVDLRLEGAQHKEVLESELERFPSITPPSQRSGLSSTPPSERSSSNEQREDGTDEGCSEESSETADQET